MLIGISTAIIATVVIVGIRALARRAHRKDFRGGEQMALSAKEYKKLWDILTTRSDECEGCPFFIEYAERMTWLDHQEEGRVMCGLLGGIDGNLEEDCKIIKLDNEEASDENAIDF